jgi:excinuclease UvrABC nuclease subunit
MGSSDLSEHGFAAWLPFNRKAEASLIAAVPKTRGVYVIRCCCREYERVRGASDILYVGSAANRQGLRMRLRQYFHPGPTQRTNRRILAIVAECNDFEVAYAETGSAPEARSLESELLGRYESDHGELPPENRRR